MIRALFIDVLSGFHRDVAGFRDCLALDIDGAEVGSDGDVLFRLDCFLIWRLVETDDDIAVARLH